MNSLYEGGGGRIAINVRGKHLYGACERVLVLRRFVSDRLCGKRNQLALASSEGRTDTAVCLFVTGV